MKILPILLLLFSCASSDAKREKSENQTTVWQGDFASAVAFAKKHNRFILIDRFGSDKDTSSYYNPQKTVKKNVYSSQEWMTYVDQMMVVFVEPHYTEDDGSYNKPYSMGESGHYLVLSPDSLKILLKFSLAADSFEVSSSRILPKDFVATVKRGLYSTKRVKFLATANLDKVRIREWHRYMDTLELVQDSMQFLEDEYKVYWSSVKTDFSKNLRMLEARSYWRTLNTEEDSAYTEQFLAPYVGKYAPEGEVLRKAIKEYHTVSAESKMRKEKMEKRLKKLQQQKNALLDKLMSVDDITD